MREEMFLTLEKYSYEILKKQEYYQSRVRQKSKLIESEKKKALELGILPRTFDWYFPKVEKLKISFFTSIIKIIKDTAYFLDFMYVEDDNPDILWTIIDMDRESTHHPYTILFTQHYLERYSERNQEYKRFTGNLKEAVILDIFSGASVYKTGLDSVLLGQFIDPSVLFTFTQKDRIEWENNIKEFAGVGDNEIQKYLNPNENICITKTIAGYGIYEINEYRITMITWIGDDMLGDKQRSLFEGITQKFIEIGKL